MTNSSSAGRSLRHDHVDGPPQTDTHEEVGPDAEQAEMTRETAAAIAERGVRQAALAVAHSSRVRGALRLRRDKVVDAGVTRENRLGGVPLHQLPQFLLRQEGVLAPELLPISRPRLGGRHHALTQSSDCHLDVHRANPSEPPNLSGYP